MNCLLKNSAAIHVDPNERALTRFEQFAHGLRAQRHESVGMGTIDTGSSRGVSGRWFDRCQGRLQLYTGRRSRCTGITRSYRET